MIKPVLLTLLLALSAGLTQAQTIWRCGAEARSYSDAPCPGGRPVVVDDSRSAADVADAREVLARDQRLAQQLVIERREREHDALSRGSGLMAIGPSASTERLDRLDRRAKLKPSQARPLPKRRPTAAAETSRSTARGTRRIQD